MVVALCSELLSLLVLNLTSYVLVNCLILCSCELELYVVKYVVILSDFFCDETDGYSIELFF